MCKPMKLELLGTYRANKDQTPTKYFSDDFLDIQINVGDYLNICVYFFKLENEKDKTILVRYNCILINVQVIQRIITAFPTNTLQLVINDPHGSAYKIKRATDE